MSNKTPFELRFDILSLANDYCDKVAKVNQDFALSAFKSAVEMGKSSVEEWQKFAPTAPYTIQDVLKKAEEMYSFVNGKGVK